MKSSYIYIVSALIALLVGVTVFGTQMIGNTELNKNDIHSQINDFESFGHETQLLLQNYQQDKITSTYLTNQLNQIDKKFQSISDTLQGKKIAPKDFSNLKKLTNLSSEYLFMTKKIEEKTAEKQQIESELLENKKITKQLEYLGKLYE
ncbi:MAG TPA: hypothetical protein VLG67_03070 [Candidatus Saccharimonadales bacterium]|nr:hypothetical protein [Candidatus Saccharimonadales bacterium]